MTFPMSKWWKVAAAFMMVLSVSLAQKAPEQRGTEPGRPPSAPLTGGQEGSAGENRGGRGRGGQLGGAAAGFVQNPTIDKTTPELPADLKSGGVLIFSKTNGFREEASIQASNAALAVIAKQRGWPYFVTENGAIMNPDQLLKFKLVIWNNTSGDTLSEEQRAAFKTWVEAGGSFLGIHGAGGDPTTFPAPRTAAVWKWYVDTLLGAQFIGHSSIMPGDIHIEDTKSRITKGLPAVWHRSEEWYGFAESPRKKSGFHIIASVDEKSYTPGRASMGTDHPLVWWHCVGKGYALYSALGHAGTMYAEPLMIQFLDNAMAWGLAESGRPCAEK
jgi:uncharacterized protein